MLLELASYQVNRIIFGDATSFADGVLAINREQLAEVLSDDSAIESVELEIAHPGDETRIVHIMDAIEPRCKVAGHGRIFAGLLGAPDTVGSGRTHRLRGIALLTTARPPNVAAGLLQPREGLLDMSGPGAPYSLFSRTANLVAAYHAVAGAANADFDHAIRRTSLRAAEFLADLTTDLEPDEEQTFELSDVDAALPRVAYLYQAQSQGLYSDTYLYGNAIQDMVPTLIHPNETMDGALVSGNYLYACFKNPTYLHCNNPVIRELYDEHGKSLNFVGVVLYRGHSYTQAEKQRAANYAAKLAQFMRADAAVLTGEGGGNSAIDMMFALEECERLGIKTTVVTYEIGGPDGQDFPLVHSVPEADAVVSTGSVDRTLALPAMQTVIGGDRFVGTDTDASAAHEMSYDLLYCVGAQFGDTLLMGEAY